MVKIKIIESEGEEIVSREEINSALRSCNPGRPVLPATGGPKQSGGAFTHVGGIGPQGRESYQKLSAVFGPRMYPGSSCGISILGAGSLSNLRKLIQDR
jgi:hypothetical protein